MADDGWVIRALVYGAAVIGVIVAGLWLAAIDAEIQHARITHYG